VTVAWYLWRMRKYRYGSLVYILQLEHLTNGQSRRALSWVCVAVMLLLTYIVFATAWDFRGTYP
jgi:hypothetical protein